MAAALHAAAGTGCGEDAVDGATVRTTNPAVAFAPLVRFARDEPYMPVGGRWFAQRSTLRWAPGSRCEHPAVAAGTVVDTLGLVDAEWMFTSKLGKSVGYSRRAPAGAGCGPTGRAYYANQLTRPHDTTAGRAPGLRRDQGFYLDLLDDRRPGPRPRRNGLVRTDHGRSMFEQRPARVAGDPGLQLTYWMLYGMNRPTGPGGRPVAALTHEGDWERVQILLRRGDDPDSWVPAYVRMLDPDGGWRQVPWAAVGRVAARRGGRATHPELFAARGSHTLFARPGRYEHDLGQERDSAVVDVASAACDGCPRWPMWSWPVPVDGDTWYGFGGAWGEVGATRATTGPLGPHGPAWPAGTPQAQQEWRSRSW